MGGGGAADLFDGIPVCEHAVAVKAEEVVLDLVLVMAVVVSEQAPTDVALVPVTVVARPLYHGAAGIYDHLLMGLSAVALKWFGSVCVKDWAMKVGPSTMTGTRSFLPSHTTPPWRLILGQLRPDRKKPHPTWD